MTDRELMQQALDALFMFVEYDYQGNPLGGAHFNGHKAIEALRARLAQPEQEPIVIDHDGTIRLLKNPPQREWQGLTTQEIADETDIATSSNKDIFDIRKAFWCGARWAEDKLKEKNND